MVIYLLETNANSYVFRGEGGVAARLLERSPPLVGIPAPVLDEARAGILRLADGARRDALRVSLDRMLAVVAIVPFATPSSAPMSTRSPATASRRLRYPSGDGSRNTSIAHPATSTTQYSVMPSRA